jgi:hypothetical protein
MCTAHEMAIVEQNGGTAFFGWIAGGIAVPAIALNDCRGWSSADSSNFGAVWNAGPNASNCNLGLQVVATEREARSPVLIVVPVGRPMSRALPSRSAAVGSSASTRPPQGRG